MMAGFIAVVATFLAVMIRKRSRLSLRDVIDALALGGKNAITVSAACAAAGIIVGMVSLTGMGLKFSSMVVSISGGVPLIAIIHRACLSCFGPGIACYSVLYCSGYLSRTGPYQDGSCSDNRPHDSLLV